MKQSLFVFICFLLFMLSTSAQNINLKKLKSPVIFQGTETTAYRDPAVLFHNDLFYMFFTLTEIEPDGHIYMYTAESKSKDMVNWSVPLKLTLKDQNLNFSSPGNVIRFQDEWILCLQTYPRPDYTVKLMPKYGNNSARLFIMRSKDLENWSEPELLKVKGPDVPENEMGRMIDPYLIQDKDHPEKYWCFYKQNGVSMSYATDFKNWTYFGHNDSGENTCVMVENNQYILFHSPPNGIGIKKSDDLINWQWPGE